jgi:DNA-binding response OmpR family regulator
MEASEPPLRVLVAEDEPSVSDVVTRYLQRDGFVVESVSNGPDALERALAGRPDLVVLDLMLPGMDGLEVCRRIREAAPIPIIMLTARGSEDDRVTGLDLGADDYVAKPFSPRELMARIRSVLRRTAESGPRGEPVVLATGDLEVDTASRHVQAAGRDVELTAREFELLRFFMAHPGRAFRREELLEQVWGYTFGDTSTVTVHVRRLREKIESDPANPAHIRTVWGLGYRFDP